MGITMYSLPTNTMYKVLKVVPRVVSWTNIVPLTHDIIEFLDYKDYQSSTEVSCEFILKKKFSHFRLNRNVASPSSTDLLCFFAKQNKYTDIKLKDCL